MTMPQFYTTTIAPEKTANEIGAAIREHGGVQFGLEWDDEGGLSAVTFVVNTPTVGLLPVRLVPQTDGIFTRLREENALKRSATVEDYMDQARRTAWRQLRSWVFVSLEMVANGVRPMHECFMADVVVDGKRVADRFEADAALLLGRGVES